MTSSSIARPSDPTKPSPLTEQRVRRYHELARAVPGANKDELIRLEEHLPSTSDEAVVAAVVERVRATPDQTLERLRRGEPPLSD